MTNPIQGIPGSIHSIPGVGQIGQSKKPDASGFGDLLTGMIKNVEDANKQADQAVQGLLTGEASDVHSVMLAVNKADLSLRLALEVRNKLVEAYQEIMRMSV